MNEEVAVGDLSNDQVLGGLRTILACGHGLLARLLEYLAEVEDRRLHLLAGYGSMFQFCLKKLEMSEGEANRRIAAARLARKYPFLREEIGRGAIHLCAVLLVRPHLTDKNHRDLIKAASGKTKEAVAEMLAARFPQSDVPSSIRKLPTPHVATVLIAPPQTLFTQVSSPSPGAVPTKTDPAALWATTPSQSLASRPLVSSKVTIPPQRIQQQVAPLAVDRFKVQFTASGQLRQKLEHLVRLMSHRNPSHDIPTALEYAVDLAIVQLEKERLGKTTRASKPKANESSRGPTPDRSITEPHSTTNSATNSAVDSITSDPRGAWSAKTASDRHSGPTLATPSDSRGASTAKASRAIPREARRSVYERDGNQCAFVSADGVRCEERSFLEIDHIQPHALGGSNDPTNLRLHCTAHNQLRAEQAFGRSHIRDARARSKSASSQSARSVQPTACRLDG